MVYFPHQGKGFLMKDFSNLELKPEEKAFREAQDRAFELFLERHAKYGAHNISRFGFFGVVVRMSDKLERLIRASANKAKHFNDETVEDTLLDISNYALIALVVLQEKWVKFFGEA